MNTIGSAKIFSDVVRQVRNFFELKNFTEVITPILHASLPVEPAIYPLSTVWQKKGEIKKLYLSTSPESSLKKLLAQGLGNCFAMGRSFRNLEEEGRLNLPEFTILEWYREKASYKNIMEDLKELITQVSNRLNAGTENAWKSFSFSDLFSRFAKIDYETILHNSNLFTVSKDKGYKIEKSTTWEQLFHQIFLNEIYPFLPQTPYFLIDFPSRISPLCKVKEENPLIAERFELYVKGVELANGNTESTDYNSINKAFIKEREYRKSEKKPCQAIDVHFIKALKKMGQKPFTYSGVGLGMERLIMVLTGKNDINDVIINPHL